MHTEAHSRQPGTEPIDPAVETGKASAFAVAFDGEQTDGLEPHVRLLPDASAPDKEPLAPIASTTTSGPMTRPMFDPEDIERREYRLLARALTNLDLDTDHLAPMALVQLVKFLRAAGVSVPNFPATGDVADPASLVVDQPGSGS